MPLLKLFLISFFCIACASIPAMAQRVFVLQIDGAINPVAASFIERSIEKAGEAEAECLVIRLNTPGGLLKSTRVIVGDILKSPLPVVVYVSPGGAHAGSAGVFVTLAGHIAAMAPGTNMGAAHPVNMQGQSDSVMSEKATNDAAAFIRTIAMKRNRNPDWAENAVRRSISVTEEEAVSENLIDLVAPNLEALLDSIDGRTVALVSDSVTLQTRGAEIEYVDMSWGERLLDKISDPTIAYILLLLGLYGVLFELYSPGAIVPGVVGGIALILAFYAMHTLPINYAGLALIIFSMILFLLELKIVSHGILGIGGVVSLFLGSMMLIKPESSLEFLSISWSVIIASVLTTALFFAFVLGAGLRAQRKRSVTGQEGMIGDIGESLEALEPLGAVRIHGEIWQAEAIGGNISKGEKVRVVAIENLKLKVAHQPQTE